MSPEVTRVPFELFIIDVSFVVSFIVLLFIVFPLVELLLGNCGNGAAADVFSVVALAVVALGLVDGSKMLLKSVSKPASFMMLPVMEFAEDDMGFAEDEMEFAEDAAADALLAG